ncbi:MAG: serine--tRNA ligase [Dehalococcoidia bacterium]|nr:serine--tRNA ligase [Dehalococcoidia bacterium]
MLSLQLIRENPDIVRKALHDRQADGGLDEILRLDQEYRQLLTEWEELKAQRNVLGKQVGSARDAGARQGLIDSTRELSTQIDRLGPDIASLSSHLKGLLLELPNIPHPDTPVGAGEEQDVVVRSEGELPAFDFEPRPHWEIGERLGIIDFERGVKLSGSRFYVLSGAGALLQRALIAWMLDLHTQKQGYREVYPPFVVKEDCLWGSGQLPKFVDNLYHDVEDDLWLVPTAEVPVTNLHRDEILEPGTLPLHYVAYTPCFRREKMSAGRDVRGIKRGHQFDKVEMYKFCAPEGSNDELETMVRDAEDVCRGLGLPHRVKALCTGDLGFAAVKGYDIEVWAPGCGEWLEVSTCSDCGDFQARRTNIRFRREKGAKVEFVHTLNGSGLGLPRTLIAVMESYQQRDGSVVVPEALRPYMGGRERIGPEG